MLITIDKPTAKQITGGLTQSSKMPCKSFSIPAANCITGRKLAKIPGSVCEKCYAYERGNYLWPNVKDAQSRRLGSLHHAGWVEAMVTLIGKDQYFRWHDSGDIQGVWHLEKIIEVCKRTPHTKHWLPTKEVTFLRQWIKQGNHIPKNLTIRVSASMIDSAHYTKLSGCLGSAVVRENATCPASKQGNQCLDCRQCWDKTVPLVTYHLH